MITISNIDDFDFDGVYVAELFYAFLSVEDYLSPQK